MKRQIIGVAGFARSGKDTAARLIIDHHDFKQVAIADPLRRMALAMDPVIATAVKVYGWESVKREIAVRELLQGLGRAVRAEFGDTWLMLKAMNVYPSSDIVISDIRLPLEVSMIHDRGGKVIKITRPGVGPINADETEQDLDVDHEVLNNGDLFALWDQLKVLVP